METTGTTVQWVRTSRTKQSRGAHGPAPSNLFLDPPPRYVDERATLG
ncbi:hypothetical protein [Streptomyces sp. WAC07149]|nr:hypothetical protein [Streptomyces sp. WAC07149]